MLVIPATYEERGLQMQGQPGQFIKTLCEKQKLKWAENIPQWYSGPGFELKYCKQ